MTPDADVFIVGAGPAGLTAAYCLTREKSSVTVIEKDPLYVGGISRTVQYKDFRFDIGGHRFSSADKEVLDLWQEMLPGGLIERPSQTQIFHRGKYHTYPLSPSDALKKLGMFSRAACMMSYGMARLRPVGEPNSLHHWARNQFGEQMFRKFFKSYAEKVWGLSCDEISADWAAQTFKRHDRASLTVPREKKSIRRKVRSSEFHAVAPEIFQHPRQGSGMMWEAAAKAVRAGGGHILMGHELQSLTYDSVEKIWRIDVATAHGPQTHTARHVVSSAPVRELIDKLSPRPISQFHAQSLRYRDFITVALMVKRPDLATDNSIYIHDASVKVSRVQNFQARAADMAPEGMGCLGLEYFCFEGDDLWCASDDELIYLAKREAAHIGLVAVSDIADACVVRQLKAYPIYDDDHRHNMAMIRLDLETHYPTLHLVGRNGMHKDNSLDHAMMTAILTARNILADARIHDVWNIGEAAVTAENTDAEAA